MSSNCSKISIIRIVLILSGIILTSIIACTEPDLLPTPTMDQNGFLYGQVHNISYPGPIPDSWVPPPYESVCTVVVQDIQQRITLEIKTTTHGKFQIIAPPGTYYLHVKESPLSFVTGPYLIKAGVILEVNAFFDNGMR